MAKETNISWCDSTFNPWIGCTKVSWGCFNCYAEADFDHRKHLVTWGPDHCRHRTSVAYWRQPYAWNRAAMGPTNGDDPLRKPRVFCASLSDWLDDEVPVHWLWDLLNVIRETPNLNWLLLTKRPQNFQRRMQAAYNRTAIIGEPKPDFLFEWYSQGSAPANVWIGVSVEDQKWADERVPILLTIPAKVHFVSYEPALGPVNFLSIDADGVYNLDALRGVAFQPGNESPIEGPKVDWVIAGGESGPKARACNPDWFRAVRDQCAGAKTAFFMKQMGSARPRSWKDAKGGDPEEWPSDLRIREFPS